MSISETDTEIANILISLGVVASMDMADKTHDETTLSRSEAAEHLRSLGIDLADDPEAWTVPVGNKTVETHPGPDLTVETTVDERSRLLGDDLTEVTIKLSWKESGEAVEGGES